MTSMKKIKPLGKKVLVKRNPSPLSKGGILLPDTSQEKSKQGEVVAVGPGSMGKDGTLVPLDVQVGDHVLFGAFAGNEVDVEEGEGHLLMSEDDILVVVE